MRAVRFGHSLGGPHLNLAPRVILKKLMDLRTRHGTQTRTVAGGRNQLTLAACVLAVPLPSPVYRACARASSWNTSVSCMCPTVSVPSDARPSQSDTSAWLSTPQAAPRPNSDTATARLRSRVASAPFDASAEVEAGACGATTACTTWVANGSQR